MAIVPSSSYSRINENEQFEEELGFRPLLKGPTYEDIVAQDEKNGQALMANYTFPGPDPSIKHAEHITETGIRLKSYTPPNFKPGQPIVLYIHGGGFAMGSVDLDDRFCNILAKDTGCVFVSVEYRLAPQHKYPIALSDCVEGAGWCIDNAESLNCSKGRIVIMGKSAGGSLALGTALKLIDGGRGANIVGVVAGQPCTVHPNKLPPGVGGESYKSYNENATNTVNTKEAMLAFYGMLRLDRIETASANQARRHVRSTSKRPLHLSATTSHAGLYSKSLY